MDPGGLGHRDRHRAGCAGRNRQGFFRSVCSLGGLFFGLVLAAWNYRRMAAAILIPLVRSRGGRRCHRVSADRADGDGAVQASWERFFRRHAQDRAGCLDRLAGAVFGFFQGVLLVTLCILVTVAFFPAGPVARRGQAAQVFLRRLPREHQHEPGRAGGAHARKSLRSLEAGIARLDASRKRLRL